MLDFSNAAYKIWSHPVKMKQDLISQVMKYHTLNIVDTLSWNISTFVGRWKTQDITFVVSTKVLNCEFFITIDFG